MRTTFPATIAAVALAVSLAGPVQAQLLGGGIGGALGGSVGLPIGGINGAGNIGVNGAVDGVTGSARAAARVRQTVRVPAVAVPPARVPARVAAVPVPAVPAVRSIVAVPVIPDIAVRRTAIVATGIAPVTYAEVPEYIDRQYVTLRDDLQGSGVEVIKRNNQIVLEMPSDVTFAFDRYDIQPRFLGVLDAVSRTLAHYPATYVDVNGHTDAIGSYAYNQRLSERRADSVANFLADRSVNQGRMHVQGFGKTEPIASNATIAGRAANRRVEIVLTPYAA